MERECQRDKAFSELTEKMMGTKRLAFAIICLYCSKVLQRRETKLCFVGA